MLRATFSIRSRTCWMGALRPARRDRARGGGGAQRAGVAGDEDAAGAEAGVPGTGVTRLSEAMAAATTERNCLRSTGLVR